MTYGDYLDLERLLSSQHPLSDVHDEMLFIIQHQTSELWMKLAIHELSAACQEIAADRPTVAFKMLSRVSRILEQLNSAWDVLRTMTPSEFSAFRGVLGTSSGFQSWQYRALEFIAGNRNAGMLALHQARPEVHRMLDSLAATPSLYDQAIALMARHGLAIAPAVLNRDIRQTHVADDSVRAAWLTVYRHPQQHWTLYELGEELVDFEDYFRRWRFNHVTTVSRIIGSKRGTGGTSGVSYLKRMTEVVLFPELWEMRSEL